MNEFEKISEQAAHAQEIANSRVGCLGGSDAAMVAKVGRSGVGALSNTDIKRLRIMLGLEEYRQFGGNIYTKAGHDFEDMVQDMFDFPEREKRLEGDRYKHFICISHADFYRDGVVVECKCVQHTDTAKVLKKYMPQLQWYYMNGAGGVQLLHGCGLDGNIAIVDVVPVGFDTHLLNELRKGCELIDAYCEELLAGNVEQLNEQEQADEYMQEQLAIWRTKKQAIDTLTNELNEVRDSILAYMEENEIVSTRHDDIRVSYTKQSVTRTLDTRKILTAYPELKECDELYTEKERKASITISIAKKNESKND